MKNLMHLHIIRCWLAALVLGLAFTTLHAQLSSQGLGSGLSYGFNHIDRNIRYEQLVLTGRHEFRVGLKYILKVDPHEDQAYSYRQRASPADFMEHLGINFHYAFEWLHLANGLSANAFFDMQVSNTSFMSKYYGTGLVYDSLSGQNEEVMAAYVIGSSRTLVFENNFGLGLRIPLTAQLSLDQQLGMGVAILRSGYAPELDVRFVDYDPILPYARVGLVWRWKDAASRTPKAD